MRPTNSSCDDAEMTTNAFTAILLGGGWLVGTLFLIASYWRAGPVWIERHSLRFKLAGRARRCSGAYGESVLLAACALLLWLVDATTPGMNFADIITRHPMAAVGALVFVAAIVAAYTASAVEHDDPKTKKRLMQTYGIYAVYSTLLFAGGMILVYCIVAQFVADMESFGAAAQAIVERIDPQALARDAEALEFAFLDAMLLLGQAKDQMTPVFIFAIAIFSINLAILYTPLRGLYMTNAVFLTNVSTLVAIAAVGAAGAIVYVASYNAFVQDFLNALLAAPRDLLAEDAMRQRRFTDIVLAMEAKKSLVGFIGDISNEWAGLTAVVGVVQAAAARLAGKPEIEGSLPTIAFDAALDARAKAETAQDKKAGKEAAHHD